MLYLLCKTSASAVMVIFITLVAERVSTRLAGVLLGFPLGAGLSLFFLGIENGPEFGAESALWCTQGILAALSFCAVYLLATLWMSKRNTLAVSCCSLLGTAGFLVCSLLIHLLMPESTLVRSLLMLVLLAVCILLFSRIPNQPVHRQQKVTPAILAFRGLFAALVILAITTTAAFIGPRWSGLFAAFPTTILPSVVVLHHRYGSAVARSLFRELPLGMIAILVFATTVHFSYPLQGVLAGTVTAYLLATCYLYCYEKLLRKSLTRLLLTTRGDR